MTATLDAIVPGSRIHLKVIARPTNQAAAKTLVRVLSKSHDVAAENKRIEKVRANLYNPTPRGGRLYGGRQVKLRPVTGDVGEEGTVRATVDVLRDLKSVARFIEINPA